jgi:hypothetical protein
VRGLSAEGGPFKIEGEYDRRGNRSRGAFLIDNGGILVIGVELDGPRTVVRPILAKQWFAKARPLVYGGAAEPASAPAAKKKKT